MCKFIFSLFSTTSKAISATSKTIETGLNVTNSALNELNRGLNNIATSLERKNKLMEIAKKVYEGQITKAQALVEVNSHFGSGFYTDFEDELNYYRDLELKHGVNEVFPIDNKEPKTREQVLSKLNLKYGKIDRMCFELHLKERRSWIINFIDDKSRNLSLLTDKELHDEFKKIYSHFDENFDI